VSPRTRPTMSLIVALLAMASLPSVAGAAGTDASPYGSVETGLALRSSRVAATAPLPAQPALTSRSRGARRAGRRGVAQPQAARPELAGARAEAAAATTSPGLLQNFNGVSSRDSAITNFGAEFEPPDQGLCVGNGFVVEMVNSAYTVYDESGQALAGPYNVNGPFNEGLTEFTSDPRCHYDAATHTWLAVILGIGPGEESSTIDVAVNTSGDPRKAWTSYKVDTTDTKRHGGHGRECPCFGDQPKLGIDASNLYITTDEFSILGPQFNGDQIYAFALKDLVAGAEAVHFAHFSKLTIGGAPANAVQPALTTGAAPAEYFMSSLDPTETAGDQVGVWAMTDVKAVAKGGVPKLSSVVLGSQPFAMPVPAEQKGSSTPIEGGDDRMQQTQFIDGRLWGELTTSLTVAGESPPRDGAAWFVAEPVLRSGLVGSGTRLVQQGYVAAPGSYFLYPALQVTHSGAGAMVGSLTSSKRFPSAAYATLSPAGAAFAPIQTAAPGTTNYSPEAERWGDYSWAVLDPAATSVWLATEYVPPKASQTPDGRRNWGTRVLQVPSG
jgi:hypothetical protein